MTGLRGYALPLVRRRSLMLVWMMAIARIDICDMPLSENRSFDPIDNDRALRPWPTPGEDEEAREDFPDAGDSGR